ncbi:MAG: hypothetical protein ACR2OB_01950 [Solirubrobacteraceae bacterium]
MSSVDQSLHACADLFCAYHDELDDQVARERWLEWEREPGGGWESLKSSFRDDVIAGKSALSISMRVDNGDDRPRRLYAALRGMDEAFRYVNPILKGNERTPRALVRLEAHVAAPARLDSGANGGALIPRLVRRDDPVGEVEHKRDLFSYVQRVPAGSWDRSEIQVLDASVAIESHDLLAGLDIACVPVIADPSEMRFETREIDGRRCYRISPRDLARTRERIPEIVAALDASGAIIALAPEATLIPTLLECWQESLRLRRATSLRWVLAGSGDLTPGGKHSSNTAVLLDGRTGQVIGSQHKLYPFNLSAEIIERWDLSGHFGKHAMGEDLAPVERILTVFDAGAIRAAIVICEDLNKPLDLGPLIRDLGISHLFVPVFSRQIKPHRWEQTAAAVHARATGTTVTVTNSMIIATALGDHDPGTALAITPGEPAVIGRSAGPADMVCFRLLPDGTVELH